MFKVTESMFSRAGQEKCFYHAVDTKYYGLRAVNAKYPNHEIQNCIAKMGFEKGVCTPEFIHYTCRWNNEIRGLFNMTVRELLVKVGGVPTLRMRPYEIIAIAQNLCNPKDLLQDVVNDELLGQINTIFLNSGWGEVPECELGPEEFTDIKEQPTGNIEFDENNPPYPYFFEERNDNSKTPIFTINSDLFRKYLKELGVGYMKSNNYEQDYSRVLYRRKKHILTKIDMQYVQNLVTDMIAGYIAKHGESENSMKKKDAFRDYCKLNGNITGDVRMLPARDVEVTRSTKNCAYIPFQNAVAVVRKIKDEKGCFDVKTDIITYEQITANSQLIKDLGLSNALFWDSWIIPRDLPPEILIKQPEQGEFQNFCYTICSRRYELKDFATGDAFNQYMHKVNTKYQAIKSLIGYIIHDYKDPSLAKLVYLTDEKQSENGEDGRTGKSLLCKAISYFRKAYYIDGKNYVGNPQFFFDGYRNQPVVVIDEVSKLFRLEMLYSKITSGIEVNEKNKGKYFIPYEDSPKFVIAANTRNYKNTASAHDRLAVFNFTDYYSAEHRPGDIYNHNFFGDEWQIKDPENHDFTQWELFDLFMLECLACFMKFGICEDYFTDNTFIKSKYESAVLNIFENLQPNSKGVKALLYRDAAQKVNAETGENFSPRFCKQLINNTISRNNLRFEWILLPNMDKVNDRNNRAAGWYSLDNEGKNNSPEEPTDNTGELFSNSDSEYLNTIAN